MYGFFLSLPIKSEYMKKRRNTMFDFEAVSLPDYSKKEDIVNSVTHALGVPFAIAVITLCTIGCATYNLSALGAFIVYGITMIILYSCSAAYHALNPGFAKKVMRVVDHSVVFLLIAGSITPFSLIAIRSVNNTLGIAVCVISWAVTLIGMLMTFINQEKFKVVQFILYISMGFIILTGAKAVYTSCYEGKMSVVFMVAGGIAYLIGAALYGVGKKVRYFHSIFHIFILLGSVIHFIGFYKYVIHI